VPADQPEAETKAGKSEVQAEAKADDGDAEEELCSIRATASRISGLRMFSRRATSIVREADDVRAQMEAYKLRQMEMMRNEVAMMRNLQPAQPAENKAESVPMN
jgi:hypothetical protein